MLPLNPKVDTVEGGARGREALAVAVMAAALAGIIAWLSMGGSGLAKDFSLPWTAARHLLEGRDPYAAMAPTGVYPFNVPFYYPLPAAVIAMPFSFMPATVAGISFVVVSFAVAGFVLARDNPARAIILLGFPAVMAATLGQWSPLLLAATVAPALQFAMPVKPTLGAAVFVNRPSWIGLAAAGVVVLLSFTMMPQWVGSWRAAVASAWDMYTSPVRWAGGAGFVLFSALIWWRDRDARLLLVLAIAPQLPLFYDQLLAHGVARTKREAWIVVAAGWVGGLLWAFQGSAADRHERPARGIILATIYLPALAIIALRARRRNLSPGDPRERVELVPKDGR